MDLKELSQRLELPNNHFEGHLVLRDHNIIWTLHFAQGRLMFATDELHSIRRWNRTINQYFPKFQLNIETSQLSEHKYWQLYLLEQGFQKQQLSLVRAKLMLRETIQECLFELSQCTSLESEWQSVRLPISRFFRTIALSKWEVQMIMHKVKDMQQDWQQIELTGVSPILSPTLTKPVDPQHLTIPHHYITGKYTLWYISRILNTSLIEITTSLLPLARDEVLEFKSVPDLPLIEAQLSPFSITPEQSTPVTAQSNFKITIPSKVISKKTSKSSSSLVVSTGISSDTLPPETISSNNDHQPLIACIDDSPVLAYSLKKILATGGYRTLIIPEPMQGFSKLIEHMPSLILLDVMLPNTDGYNICRFLRDTSAFKETPIIILTGRSKPVDRARASMAGATEFLVKPPEAKELLKMIRKHLRTSEKLSS
ncbi:MAG: response regulator [Cyanobacteria bacterium P01_H01_bin.105]